MKKITRFATVLALAASFGMPLFTAAQINKTVIESYSRDIINIINGIIVPVLLAIAFIVFIWGVYKYFILGAADEKSRTDGKQFTFWGVIGFVVIFSVWGLVNIVIQALNLNSGNTPRPPTFNVSPSTGSSSNLPWI